MVKALKIHYCLVICLGEAGFQKGKAGQNIANILNTVKIFYHMMVVS